MNYDDLPEPSECPASWKYTEEWQEKYRNKHGWDWLSKICKHSSAQTRIFYYICDMGEMALTKVKTQNLLIKRIKAGSIDPVKVRDHHVDYQSGHTWERLREDWEELFEIYNADRAPTEILEIIGEVKAFMDAGQSHCMSLLQYIANAKAARDEQKAAELEEARMQHRRANKWVAVDLAHSKISEGFIYLLSNELMPGIYKIGFTAGNPDKRAKELSMQHGLPTSFRVVEYWRTKDPYVVEQRIHEALAAYGKAGEFFEVDLTLAKSTIQAQLKGS